MREIWVRRLGWLSSVALVFLSSAALHAGAQSSAESTQSAAASPSQFWLGVFSTPVDETLRSHLQLAEGQGLVIRDVAPDSPAAAAGLKAHDVLLSLGGKDLAEPDQLCQVVDALGETEAEAVIIRAGKSTTLRITPGRRPTSADAGSEDAVDDDEVSRGFSAAINGWVENFGGEKSGRRIGFHVVRPGVIDTSRLDIACATKILPKDLRVRVDYEGAKPPVIEVFRGKDHWKAAADNLDALPPDVRMHAWQITQPSVLYVPRERFPGTVEIQAPDQSAGPSAISSLVEPRVMPVVTEEEKLKKTIEQLSLEIANLRKSVDKLAARPACGKGALPPCNRWAMNPK